MTGADRRWVDDSLDGRELNSDPRGKAPHAALDRHFIVQAPMACALLILFRSFWLCPQSTTPEVGSGNFWCLFESSQGAQMLPVGSLVAHAQKFPDEIGFVVAISLVGFIWPALDSWQEAHSCPPVCSCRFR